MSNYKRNKALARTTNHEPTLTDQSQARETDINVLVGRMMQTGVAPAPPGQPMYADWTQLPRDLRGMIELGRSLTINHNLLPPQLKNIPLQQLLALTNQQIADILAPPDPTQPPKEEPNK